MIATEQSVAIVLAAGRSNRFGVENKLLAPLGGRPLIAHVLETVGSLPLIARLCVVAADDRKVAALASKYGLEHVDNDLPEAGQERSVRLGLSRALGYRPEAVILCLADMPGITASHLLSLASAATPDRAAMTSAGAFQSPPAIIPKRFIDRILENPERRVRDVLVPRSDIPAPQSLVMDVDTPDDLERLMSQLPLER